MGEFLAGVAVTLFLIFIAMKVTGYKLVKEQKTATGGGSGGGGSSGSKTHIK